MSVKNLTLENYEEAFTGDKPALIDFYADWCGPCQMMKPVFEDLSKEFEGKVSFFKIDTQAEEALAIKFGIQGIPALVFMNQDKEVDRFVGFSPEDALREKINSALEKIKKRIFRTMDFSCKKFNIDEVIKCSLGLTKSDFKGQSQLCRKAS